MAVTTPELSSGPSRADSMGQLKVLDVPGIACLRPFPKILRRRK